MSRFYKQNVIFCTVVIAFLCVIIANFNVIIKEYASVLILGTYLFLVFFVYRFANYFFEEQKINNLRKMLENGKKIKIYYDVCSGKKIEKYVVSINDKTAVIEKKENCKKVGQKEVGLKELLKEYEKVS